MYNIRHVENARLSQSRWLPNDWLIFCAASEIAADRSPLVSSIFLYDSKLVD